jgi:hypothetical protein
MDAFIAQPLCGREQESDGVSSTSHSRHDWGTIRLLRSLCRYFRRGVDLRYTVRTCLTLPHHCAAYSLYFLLCRTLGRHGQPPSNAVRTLTGMKQPSDSTLDAPPRQHRAPRTSTAIATPPTGATGQGRALGMVRRLPRMMTTPGATPHSARQQGPSTVLPRFGEKRTNLEISHACNPSLI